VADDLEIVERYLRYQ